MSTNVASQVKDFIDEMVERSAAVTLGDVEQFVSSIGTEDLRSYTARQIRDRVGDERRMRRLLAEKRAERAQEEARAKAAELSDLTNGWRSKTRSRWTKLDERMFEEAPDSDSDKARVLSWEERDRELIAERNQKLEGIIESYTAALRMDWTRELLSTSFGLADGTVTTWGEATLAQHEERAAMFTRQAQTGIEGAARHHKAIEALRESGSVTLNVLTAVAA